MRKSLTLLVLAAGGAWAQTPATAMWNETAAAELGDFVRQTFQAWQSGNLEAIRASIASDTTLGAYDNDMTGKPVKIRSVDEEVQFAQQMFGEMKKMGATISFEMRALNCRATDTAGVCAIEFDSSMSTPDGGKQSWPMYATMVARKGGDGWKGVHWHASMAKAPQAPEPLDLGPAPIPLVSVDQKALNWKEIPGSGGIKAAVVWENPTHHGTVSYVQFPKKWQVGRHYHSWASHNVLLKGGLTVTRGDGLKEEYKPGSWTYIPGKWIHSTASKRGATVLAISDGPDDLVLVDDKGTPLPAPAAPAGAPAKK